MIISVQESEKIAEKRRMIKAILSKRFIEYVGVLTGMTRGTSSKLNPVITLENKASERPIVSQ